MKVDTVNRDLAFFKPLADTSTNCRCKCAKNGCVIMENLDKNGQKGKLLKKTVTTICGKTV